MKKLLSINILPYFFLGLYILFAFPLRDSLFLRFGFWSTWITIAPFVIFGLLRYVIIKKDASDSKDMPLWQSVILYTVLCISIVWVVVLAVKVIRLLELYSTSQVCCLFLCMG